MISLLGTADLILFAILAVVLLVVGFRNSTRKKNAEEYFMAGRSLKWWSVAGSVFGTNVSLSQIIGMLGIGYSIGFAQSHYEILAVPAILLLCYVFIPVYRRHSAFTLSAWLESRYDGQARLLYGIILLGIILILLTGGLYIGSRQLGLLFNGTAFQLTYIQGILLIAGVSCLLVFFGGMEALVISENLISVLMVLSLMLVGYLTLSQPSIGGISGLMELDRGSQGLQKMHLYLDSSHPDLPWTGVFSGLLVLQGFFWTTNQFEVQRVLAASSDRHARLGVIAAGFLKLTIPVFSVSSGVAAAYLFKESHDLQQVKPDDAFLYLMGRVVPSGYGLLGLILAGLTAAVFSSIYSMLNSASTIVSMDIYKRHINPLADDRQLVMIGKSSVVVFGVLAVIFAVLSFSPGSSGNFFLTLSQHTSYLKPGIVSAFFLGVFWRNTHPRSAVAVILAAPLLSFGLEWLYAEFHGAWSWLQASFGERLNFMHRVFIVFVLCLAVQVIMTLYRRDAQEVPGADRQVSASPAVWKALAFYAVTQLCLLLLVRAGLFSARDLAVPAAATVMAYTVFILRKRGLITPVRNMFQSDLLYAGLLASVTTGVLYYFA